MEIIKNTENDLLGNSLEWTMETKDTINRVYRSGYSQYTDYSPSLRGENNPHVSVGIFSSRPTIYIK